MLFRCDHQFLGDMSRLGVLPGSVWAEERQGTNGVGTCLQSGKSVVIAGKQHYGIATQALSCITAPVLGRRNVFQSVINVTTARECDDRTNRVVLDIVERTARRIENRYFSRAHRESHILKLFQGPESTDLSEEGRVAIDDDGLVIDASSQVSALTGFSADALIGRSVEEIFNMDLSLDNIRPDRPYQLPGRALQIAIKSREIRSSRGMPVQAREDQSRDHEPIFVTSSFVSRLPESELRIDPILSQLVSKAEKLYRGAIPLVVTGETGTGKNAFANMIARNCHSDGTRIVSIDCAAVASQKEGSALFHSRLLLADAGCLILDRPEQLDEAGQVALQALLESRSQKRPMERFGVIALTECSFEHLAKSGGLKLSLQHRLRGGTVSLPPLRLHPELEEVVSDLMEIETRELGIPSVVLSDEARLIMLSYHWPGNLRELRNTIRHSVLLADREIVGLEHLPEEMVSELAHTDLRARSKSQASRIEAALRHNGGNVSLTARYLGVSRATLYRKIQIRNSREKVS
jgi:transcriptional regulator of acetoin/glycerol metabolism